MPNTFADVLAFGPSHPIPHQGGTWNQKCEQFINNSGGFTQTFVTAELAGSASGWLDPDWTTAKPGEIHYWSGDGDGHDAWQTPKGLLCASNVFKAFWGYIDFATFAAKKRAFKYRGHTFRHGTETLASLSPTGGGVTPVIQKEIDMIGLEYHGTVTASVGARIIVDMVNRTGYYPNPDEQSAFTQSGGVWVSYNDAMWQASVAPLRVVQAGQPPAPVVSTPFDPTVLENAIVTLGTALGTDVLAIENLVKAIPAGPTAAQAAAILAALAKVPTAAQNGAAARTSIVAPAS